MLLASFLLFFWGAILTDFGRELRSLDWIDAVAEDTLSSEKVREFSFLLGCTNLGGARAMESLANERRLAVLVSPKAPAFKRITAEMSQTILGCFEINPAVFLKWRRDSLSWNYLPPNIIKQPQEPFSETPTKWLAVLLVATDTARTR